MWLFQFLIDTGAVTAVTIAWYYRWRRPSEISGNRGFAQLIALVGSTYLALAFAILSEIKAAKAPAVVTVSREAIIGHLALGVMTLAVAAFGKGIVRIATLIAAALSVSLWYVYSLLG